jgi:hypothetical protein
MAVHPLVYWYFISFALSLAGGIYYAYYVIDYTDVNFFDKLPFQYSTFLARIYQSEKFIHDVHGTPYENLAKILTENADDLIAEFREFNSTLKNRICADKDPKSDICTLVLCSDSVDAVFFEKKLPKLYNITRRIAGGETIYLMWIPKKNHPVWARRHRDPLFFHWNFHYGLLIPPNCTGMTLFYENFTESNSSDPSTKLTVYYQHKHAWLFDALYQHQPFSLCYSERILLLIPVQRTNLNVLEKFAIKLMEFLPSSNNLALLNIQNEKYMKMVQNRKQRSEL